MGPLNIMLGSYSGNKKYFAHMLMGFLGCFFRIILFIY